MSNTPFLRWLLKFMTVIFVISMVGWAAIYFTASADRRPQILKIAAMLFLASFGGIILLLVALFRRAPTKDKDKNE